MLLCTLYVHIRKQRNISGFRIEFISQSSSFPALRQSTEWQGKGLFSWNTGNIKTIFASSATGYTQLCAVYPLECVWPLYPQQQEVPGQSAELARSVWKDPPAWTSRKKNEPTRIIGFCPENKELVFYRFSSDRCKIWWNPIWPFLLSLMSVNQVQQFLGFTYFAAKVFVHLCMGGRPVQKSMTICLANKLGVLRAHVLKTTKCPKSSKI